MVDHAESRRQTGQDGGAVAGRDGANGCMSCFTVLIDCRQNQSDPLRRLGEIYVDDVHELSADCEAVGVPPFATAGGLRSFANDMRLKAAIIRTEMLDAAAVSVVGVVVATFVDVVAIMAGSAAVACGICDFAD